MEVGRAVTRGPRDLPVLSDVFGGAQGVLGIEGLANKRIFADFTKDRLTITRSHGEPAPRDFSHRAAAKSERAAGGGRAVGNVRAKAIIDTGAQGTVGNLTLRDALMRKARATPPAPTSSGVTLDVQTGDYLMAPDIDFGGRNEGARHPHHLR